MPSSRIHPHGARCFLDEDEVMLIAKHGSRYLISSHSKDHFATTNPNNIIVLLGRLGLHERYEPEPELEGKWRRELARRMELKREPEPRLFIYWNEAEISAPIMRVSPIAATWDEHGTLPEPPPAPRT